MCAAHEDPATIEEERAELWEPDWDDEGTTTEDFQQRLKHELDSHMKE